MSDTIRQDSWARVRLLPDCDGAGRPHHPAEEACCVKVTAVDRADQGDHTAFAFYEAGSVQGVPLLDGGLGLGRYLRPDELEPIPEPP